MSRTTIDIDPSVLKELKLRARREGKSLGRLLSEIAAAALKEGGRPEVSFDWRSRSMHARIDLEDEEALNKTLDSK